MNLLLWAIALALLLPIAVLTVECLAAIFPDHAHREQIDLRPRLAVMIPAHNEASEIGSTLQEILPQLRAGDRLLVVADNCSDETAAIAGDMGAMVLARNNLEKRGKGYALDFGLRYLEADPPEIVVMIDADCWVEPGAIARLAQQAASHHRPTQAIYLMETQPDPTPTSTLSALAFLIKNQVRPLGLHQLGLPCLLTGTGMAFPWSVISNSPLASDNIVEDMQLGLDLAVMGHAPMLCPNARVLGRLPQSSRAATRQRTRWEHGHLQTLAIQVPRLVGESIRQRRFDLLAIALDLLVPPLSLLVMLWLATLSMAILTAVLGVSWRPAQFLTGEGIALMVAILSSWFKFGRSMVPAQSLLSIPLYVCWKIPLYFRFLTQRETIWVRTERDGQSSGHR